MNKKVQLLIIVLAVFLAYSSTLKNEFVIDDNVFVVNWTLAHDLRNIPKFFMGENTPKGHEDVYRPLRATFYAVSFKLWGLNPVFYHAQAILIHLISVVMVYLIITHLQGEKMRSHLGGGAAFAVALLWGLHPINTEAITYTTASFDAFGLAFYFTSFYLYLRRVRVVSLIFALMAFFTHEVTLTLPLVILLYEVCFRKTQKNSENQRIRVSDNLKVRSSGILSHSELFRKISPYFILASFYMFIRVFLIHLFNRGEYLGGSFYHTMLTMTKAVVKYLTLLIWPVNLSINQTISEGIRAWVNPLTDKSIILSQSIFDLDILFAITIIIIITIIMIIARKKAPLVTFSIGWFFVSFLPASFIIPQGPVMQERYMYIPSFGFILIITRLGGLRYLRNLGIIALMILAIFYGYLTYQRNLDWKDSLSVWSKLAKQYPKDIIANFYTAGIYQQKGDDEKAISYYQKVLEIEPRVHEAYYNLGKIAQKKGDDKEAALLYQKTLQIYPDFIQAQDDLDFLTIKASSPSAQPRIWQGGLLSHFFSFNYPSDWKLAEITNGVILKSSGDFVVKMVLFRDIKETPEDYVKRSTSSYGTLKNQGQAQIPHMDKAYVKSWTGGGVERLQFFLFGKGHAVEVLVEPAGSADMKLFDRMARTFTFGE